MTLGFTLRPIVRHSLLAAALASLAACGPGKSGTTETTDTSTTGTTTDTSTTGTTTDTTTPTTTGGAIVQCVDARTEADCMTATEMDPNVGAGCRWAEVRRFKLLDGGSGCDLEAAGGVCLLADFSEGGPGCDGFFRETAEGEIEVMALDCGSPVGETEWQGCFEVAMESPGAGACECMNNVG